MANNNYQLTVVKGPQVGQTYSLVATLVTIGRDPMADIVITDPEVSRQHVRLSRLEGGYEIQDLGSTNGTFLDGRRLGGDSHPLAPGQTITLGSNVTLAYEEGGEAIEHVVSVEDEDEYSESDAADFPQVGVYDYPEVEEEDFDTVLDREQYEDVDTAELADEEAGSFDFPSFDEELPSFDEADELPDFDTGVGVYDDAEEDELPGFEREAGEKVEPVRETTPPPPGAPPPGNNRNRNLIIAVLVLLFLLCCCCLFLIGAWFYGDAFINQFQAIP